MFIKIACNCAYIFVHYNNTAKPVCYPDPCPSLICQCPSDYHLTLLLSNAPEFNRCRA